MASEERPLYQGKNSSIIFRGNGRSLASELIYNKSVDDLAEIIRGNLSPSNYSLVDIGTFKGEMLSNLTNQLKEYSFRKFGIELNKEALESNTSVDYKILADVSSIPLADDSANIAITRYVLAWNTWEQQRKILRETERVVNKFAIIQHAGPESKDSPVWREAYDRLFSGNPVAKLKRSNYFFASGNEIEHLLRLENIPFKRVVERRVDNLIDTLAERFGLNQGEYTSAKDIVGAMNYVVQTTWIIYPKSN